MADEEIRIEFVAGVEGPHVALMVGDVGRRLAGPKAWGGGRVIHSFVVDPADIASELHLCPQRDLDAARARIKELEAVVTNEAESHEELRSLDPLFYAYHDNRAAILRAALSAKGGSDDT